MAGTGGARPGAGNPGYGRIQALKKQVDKFHPKFWQKMEEFLNSKNDENAQFAMKEFNKIMVKFIPQDLEVNVSETLLDLLKGKYNDDTRESSEELEE